MHKLLRSLFSHRFLALARWEFHFWGVRAANALTGQKRRIAATLAARRRPVYLNFGSGPRGLADERWINVDGFKDNNVHFLFDLGRPLPFQDGTFDGVFTEHVLEHFTLEDSERIACELSRILAPGGTLRIVVPDAEKIVRTYLNDPKALVAWRGETGTAMETVNSVFRQRYEHQFLYDWPTMEAMLRRAGFPRVRRAAFGHGEASVLVLDDAKYEWESLYVEACRG